MQKHSILHKTTIIIKEIASRGLVLAGVTKSLGKTWHSMGQGFMASDKQQEEFHVLASIPTRKDLGGPKIKE